MADYKGTARLIQVGRNGGAEVAVNRRRRYDPPAARKIAGKRICPMSDPPKRRPTAVPAWRNRTLGELAAEQKVGPVKRVEDYAGAGAGLWRNDGEFLRFVRDIRRRRTQRA